MKGLKILGMGRCLPPTVVTNDDLAQRLDTSDQWVYDRTAFGAGLTWGAAVLRM